MTDGETFDLIGPGLKLIYPAPPAYPVTLVAHLQRQLGFARNTFGPGRRTAALLDHLRKELAEIEAAADDQHAAQECIDVIILAFELAMRRLQAAGEHDPAAAAARLLLDKQTQNEGRVWPDWRTADPEKAIEHDRSRDHD